LPYVFNRFYRVRQAPHGPATGSGLGLPIAKWIIDTHGSRVVLSSTDRPTVMTIRLPLIP
jgi:two-component system OmpR family sensor kinase